MSNSVKTVGNIFIIIMFAKVLGQVREMLLAAAYGTGYQAQAFLTASQIPLNFFDMILGLAIVSAFVPVFNEFLQKDGIECANDFAGNFVGVVIAISVVVSVLGVIFSAFLISVISRGLDAQTQALAAGLIKILFPSIIFTSIAYSYAGILQSFGEFKIPAAMSVISNGITILYFLMFNSKVGIYGLAVSMLVGWILQLAILILPLKKFGYKFKISFDFMHAGMIKVYKLALPILLSSWAQPLNVMVNLYLASFLNGGRAVAAINYANRLYIIIAGVFTMSVTNLILPSLSRYFSAGDTEKSAEVINNSVKSVILFLLPVMGLFILFRVQIIRIIYQRGDFDVQSTLLTSTALLFYSFGMLGYGLQEVMNKTFYAMQKPKTPMKIAIFTIVINLICSFSLFRIIGIGGLAVSASIAATTGGVLLLALAKKENSGVSIKEMLIVFAKGLFATVFACGISALGYKFLCSAQTGTVIELLRLCGFGIFTVLIYLGVLVALRVKEIKSLFSLLRSR